jgi:Rrf2 family transcriptional regulator, cysteine metabolism repressor
MISNKCIYALNAMLELAVQTGNRLVTIGEIAAARNIPDRFLEAIMRQLKQAELADSVRGKEGGYRLAKPAARISVGRVVRLFEGPLFAATAGERTPDVLNSVWKEAESAMASVLDKTTFADLAERERNDLLAGATSYSI